ncbi:hypothetical protein WCE55_02215 [Luteimonas sp. MJ293]|uniref:hypothetical protein n=1 Tax=Luteimonas sp. MJ146 TaxID=3129240 RepID=UPI0031BBA05F
MTRLPAWLGTQPLLYVIAALVALAIGLGLYAERLNAKLDVATASSQSAMSLARLHQTERDAWKLRADELTASVAAHRDANTALAAELRRAQADAVTLKQQDARALAQARAATDEANRTLASFMQRYHTQIRAPACERALDQLEAACPALSGY